MIIITNKDEQKNDDTLTIIKLTMTIIRIDMIRYASNFIYFIFGPW